MAAPDSGAAVFLVTPTFMLYGSTIANLIDNSALYLENNEYSENKHEKWVFFRLLPHNKPKFR